MDPGQQSILFEIILNSRKPIVLRKFSPNWKCFDRPIDEWCKQFDTAPLKENRFMFEQMPKKFPDIPQWERYRSKIESTFTNFLSVHSKNTENWTAFNYKHANVIPLDCRYDVDFSCFGFPYAAKDVSFWLCSSGANTPCHYDTYGCNVVVQVYGRWVDQISAIYHTHFLSTHRKHWILFPPDTPLNRTRVPYEESSVYCLENFYSPQNLGSLTAARQNAFECILEEGDVLIVPKNWWHYVESIDISLSVNAWIPLKDDINSQIKECIVKFIVEQIVSSKSEEEKHYILNPNQLELITSSDELFRILRFLLETSSLSEKTIEERAEDTKYPYQYLTETEVSDLISKSKYDICVLRPLAPNKFDNIMLAKTKRWTDMELQDSGQAHPMFEALLNAMCHPNVIKKITDQFLKTYSSCI